MNEDTDIPNINASLIRRTLATSEKLEQLTKDNHDKLQTLLRLNQDVHSQILTVKEMLNTLYKERLFYLLLGISVGLAGRGIVSDILELLK